MVRINALIVFPFHGFLLHKSKGLVVKYYK